MKKKIHKCSMFSFKLPQSDYLLFLFLATMAIFTQTSGQKGSISCMSEKLAGLILPDTFVLKCSLNRELNDNETAVWLFPNCSAIGTCKGSGSGCIPQIYQKGNEYLTFSILNNVFIMYIMRSNTSDYFIFSINETFVGRVYTQIVYKNGNGCDSRASQHFLTSCLNGNTSVLASDCSDNVTNNIQTDQTTEEDYVTDYTIVSISTKLGNGELFPIPTNEAYPQLITIPLMFAVIIVVSMLLLTSRLYSCLVHDTNCCRKTHSFQPSENAYQIYETVQNNDNVEAIAMASLQTPSLPRSVIHSIESGSIGRLMSLEVTLDGNEVDVKEERPPVPPRNDSKSNGESKQQSTTDSSSDVESQEQNRADSTTETSSSEMEGQEDRSGQETPSDSGHGSFNDLEAGLRSEMDTSETTEVQAVDSFSNEQEERRMRFDPAIDDMFNSPQYDTLRSKKRKEKD